ncbi:MAG TPA: HAMP domain-containing sensor histidine kinase [Anaerolineae bacterium]|nr:HAMP domain-containing sensor histidine kinase [Anaerolineae bacterium]
MKRLKTLRVRFALWTAGLLFAALTLFGLFVYANMSRSLAAAVDEKLRLVVVQLVAEVDVEGGEPVINENPIEDPEYAQLREQGFSMRLLDLTGQVVQEFGPYRDLPQPQLSFIVPDQPGEFTTLIDAGSQDPVRVYTTPIVVEEELVGTLQVAQNLKEVRRTLDLLLITLLLGGPLIVIVAGSGGYFLAARALAPIDKITRMARYISAEELSARLNLPETDDEVGRLAATFDSMLARLDDAFRRERQFTADASHELRTPLSAIHTIIGSTLARRRAPAEYEQAMIDLGQEAERMRTLTEGLLDLARLDATRQPAKFERVDLSNLLKDVVDSLRPLAEDKGLKLIDHVPDNGLTLMGDSDGLIRLFVNLLDNAIKYTEQGSITISAHPTSEQLLEVTIRDTGVGMTPEHLTRIFDRFYRVDASRSKDGIGLGLAIVKNAARAHGGKVSVESKFGEGTTFIVQLPTK